MAFDPDAYLKDKEQASFDPDKYLADREEGPSALATFGQKFIEAPLMGAADEGAGAMEVLGQTIGIEGLGASDFGELGLTMPYWMDAEKQASDIYRDRQQEHEAFMKMHEQANPKAALAGDIAGGMLIPGAGVAKGASLLDKVKKGAKVGAATGALGGWGQADAGDTADIIQDTAIGAGLGAGLGAGIPVAGEVLAPVGSAIKKGVGELADMIGLPNVPKAFSKKVANPDMPIVGKEGMQSVLQKSGDLRDDILNYQRTYNSALDKMKKNLIDSDPRSFDKVTHIDTVQDFIQEVNRPGTDPKFLKEAQELLNFESKFFEDLGGRLGISADDAKVAMQGIDDKLASDLANTDFGFDTAVRDKADDVLNVEKQTRAIQQNMENKISRFKIASDNLDKQISDINQKMSTLPESTNLEMVGKDAIAQGKLNQQMNTQYSALERQKQQLISKKKLLKAQHDLELSKLQRTYDESAEELTKDSLDQYMEELVEETSYAKTQLREGAELAKKGVEDQTFVAPRGASASEMETARKALAQKAKLDSSGQPLTEAGKEAYRDWGKAFYTDQLNRTDEFDEATKQFLKTKSLGGLEEQELALFQEGGMLLPQVNELRHKTIQKLKALGLGKIDLTEYDANALNAIEKKVDQMIGTGYKTVPAVGDIKKAQDLEDLISLLKYTAPEGKASDISSKVQDLSERFQLAKDTVRTDDLANVRLFNIPGWFTRIGAGAGQVAGGFKQSASNITAAMRDASSQELQELAGLVAQEGSEAAKYLSNIIGNTLSQADKNRRTAVLFGLMQHPKYREILQSNNEDNR